MLKARARIVSLEDEVRTLSEKLAQEGGSAPGTQDVIQELEAEIEVMSNDLNAAEEAQRQAESARKAVEKGAKELELRVRELEAERDGLQEQLNEREEGVGMGREQEVMELKATIASLQQEKEVEAIVQKVGRFQAHRHLWQTHAA